MHPSVCTVPWSFLRCKIFKFVGKSAKKKPVDLPSAVFAYTSANFCERHCPYERLGSFFVEWKTSTGTHFTTAWIHTKHFIRRKKHTERWKKLAAFHVCTRCYMLSVCQPHQHESSVCHTSRSLVRHAIFSLTGPPRRVNCLAQFREYRYKVFFPQGHNDTLPCSETESRQPCGCQLAFLSTELHKDTTAGYTQCGHRTCNLTITASFVWVWQRIHVCVADRLEAYNIGSIQRIVLPITQHKLSNK